MARKKQQVEVVTEPTSEGQGWLEVEIDRIGALQPQPNAGHNGGPPMDAEMAEVMGGMSVEAYVQGVYEGVQDALGDSDIYMVARVLDESIAELLAVMRDAEGTRAAQNAAIGFAETILPYARGPEIGDVPYKRLRKPLARSRK